MKRVNTESVPKVAGLEVRTLVEKSGNFRDNSSNWVGNVQDMYKK